MSDRLKIELGRAGPMLKTAPLLTALLLSACAAPDMGARPERTPPAGYATQQTLAVGPVGDAWPQDRWWERYADPQLDALVEEALRNSPSVAEAEARILIASGLVRQAGAAGLPQVGVSGEAGAQKQSYNNGIPADFVPKGWKSYGSLTVGADFDLDLWGKNRAALAAATSDELATRVDAREAELALQANVVEHYARLGIYFVERDLLASDLKARQATADLYAQRYRGGLDSKLPQQQAEAAAATAAARLEANAERIALERNVLAALLGAGPDRGLQIAKPSVRGPFARVRVPADAGIALAGRRADIVAARLRVEAQGHRIEGAEAAFMPDINLGALAGFMSLGLANLFDAGSDYGKASAAFSLPIFDGGMRRGNLVQATGRYDELVAEYDATVIGALKDVADALASRDSVERQSAEADRAAAAAVEGYALADARYRGGLTNYLDALSAQTAMFDAQHAALEAHARIILADIQLVRALGGGFAPESDPAATDAAANPTESDRK